MDRQSLGFETQNIFLELFSLCNKFEYYNFITCVVIVSPLLYNSYNWSNNHFCSHSPSFHHRAVREKRSWQKFLVLMWRVSSYQISIYVHFFMVVLLISLSICDTHLVIIIINNIFDTLIIIIMVKSTMHSTQKSKKTERKKKVIPVKPISWLVSVSSR